MTTAVRTRIAPSPTGFLHLGTARTALYSWAFARHHGGQFVLRIEDTDVGRSTEASTQQIIDSMHWLGLGYDEGPIFQMQRLERYHAVVEQMLAAGTAYRCYTTPDELAAMKAAQQERGEKRRYDGTWRPAPGKVLPPVPAGVQPVVRFANPEGGAVSWDDLVKGPITIGNVEIDDLIILRTDRVPTYNFAVVVDDWDMAITHVFRGEDHVNNTPWQINLYEALGAPLPRFGHLPLILDETGRKMSKRRSAVSVTTYKDGGYLPEAMLNYLARLGWSHGDDELFTPQQMVQWFDGTHLARAAAMWDKAKLLWVNAHHVKHASDARLAPLVREHLARKNIATADEDLLARAAALFKDRCSTVAELAEWCEMLFAPVEPKAEELTTHLTEPVRAALPMLVRELDAVPTWDKAGIAAAMKAALAATGLKMGQLAPAVRVLVCGRSQTPSIDAVLALFSRDTVRARLMAA